MQNEINAFRFETKDGKGYWFTKKGEIEGYLPVGAEIPWNDNVEILQAGGAECIEDLLLARGEMPEKSSFVVVSDTLIYPFREYAEFSGRKEALDYVHDVFPNIRDIGFRNSADEEWQDQFFTAVDMDPANPMPYCGGGNWYSQIALRLDGFRAFKPLDGPEANENIDWEDIEPFRFETRDGKGYWFFRYMTRECDIPVGAAIPWTNDTSALKAGAESIEELLYRRGSNPQDYDYVIVSDRLIDVVEKVCDKVSGGDVLSYFGQECASDFLFRNSAAEDWRRGKLVGVDTGGVKMRYKCGSNWYSQIGDPYVAAVAKGAHVEPVVDLTIEEAGTDAPIKFKTRDGTEYWHFHSNLLVDNLESELEGIAFKWDDDLEYLVEVEGWEDIPMFPTEGYEYYVAHADLVDVIEGVSDVPLQEAAWLLSDGNPFPNYAFRNSEEDDWSFGTLLGIDLSETDKRFKSEQGWFKYAGCRYVQVVIGEPKMTGVTADEKKAKKRKASPWSVAGGKVSSSKQKSATV